MSCTFWNMRREKAKRVKKNPNNVNANITEAKEEKTKRETNKKRGDK